MFIGAGDTEPLTSASGPRVACCRRAWIDAYADRVERMMRTYMRSKRRPVYWLTLPAARQPERRDAVPGDQLRDRAGSPQGRRKDARGRHGAGALAEQRVPPQACATAAGRVVVRDRDGVHLTTAGARIARDLVVRAMRRDGVLGARRAGGGRTATTASLVYEPPIRELDIPAAYALSVEAGAAQSNRIAVAEDAGEIHRRRPRARPLQPGPGCEAVDGERGALPDPARRRRPQRVRRRGRRSRLRCRSAAWPPRPVAEARGGGGRRPDLRRRRRRLPARRRRSRRPCGRRRHRPARRWHRRRRAARRTRP